MTSREPSFFQRRELSRQPKEAPATVGALASASFGSTRDQDKVRVRVIEIPADAILGMQEDP